MPAPEVDGLVTSAEVQETVDAIAEWQLPTGMVPWFPGGHADPWNHVEAAMALALGGRRADAERAYEWLVDLQRPDGSWHQYYLDDGVEQDKLDANVVAYVAAGVWHHWLLTRRPGLPRGHVAGGRQGHRLRARPPDRPGRDPLGPPRRRHAVVVRPAHRLVEHLPQPALRHRPRRPSSATSARTGSRRPAGSPTSSAPSPTPSPPSTAGRWTGTTRCSAARSWARTAGPASPPATPPSSWTATACAACRTGRGSPSPRPASAPWPTWPSASARPR